MSFMDAREHGSKPGAGFVSSQAEAVDRRERLRRLALETIDLSRDPYFMRNHLGQYECRLCLTLHGNEGSYLAHTQGKRHQQNLAKRAAREAAERPAAPAPARRAPAPRARARIGRPGYRVTKQADPETGARALLFQVEYPEVEAGCAPRHRLMSAYEQRREPCDRRYQYVLFAAEPYETVAFKVPALEVDAAGRAREKMFSHWDPDAKTYSLQVPFKAGAPPAAGAGGGGFVPPPPPGAVGGGGFMPPPPPGAMGGGFVPPPGAIGGGFVPPPPPGATGGGFVPPPPPGATGGGFVPPPPPGAMGGGGFMPPPPPRMGM